MSSFPKDINPEKEEDDIDNNNFTKIMSLINKLNEKSNISKLKDINSKCVDLIFEEKTKKSLECLKKLESFLEGAVIDNKILIPKKYIIIVLHNIACCFQKLKDLNKTILYLEALIYHFDVSLEKKYKISINSEYFDSLIKSQNYFYDKKNLGDLILELRFCAKFHIQMSVVLSQAKRHVDSLFHAKLAALICEDNIIKTSYLYQIVKNDFQNNKIKENGSNNTLNIIKEQIKQNYKIIFELKKRIYNLRNNSFHLNNNNHNNNKSQEPNKINKTKINSVYNNYFKYLKNMVTKISRNTSNEKNNINISNKNQRNFYNSYEDFRKKQIDIYIKDKIVINDIKNIFEKKFTQIDDWIKTLKIDSIIYLSPLNYDDLDLDSDAKYELLRDSLLEKVIMLNVAYYCLSNELRILSKDKNNKNTNGEYYLYNALYLSLIFLPPNSPITNHYMISYYKNYKQGMDIIPEGQIMNYNIDLFRKEILNEKNKDINNCIYFIRGQRINKIIKEEKIIENNEPQINTGNNTNISNDNKSFKKKGIVIYPNEFSKRKKIENDKIIINIKNIRYKQKKNEEINTSDTNIFNKNINTSESKSKISNSRVSINTSIDMDTKNTKLINGTFELIPNNNFFERAKKSRIQEVKAPKFKLNFNKINFNNNSSEAQASGNKTNNSNKEDINYIVKKKFAKIRLKKNLNNFMAKKNINITMNNSDRKMNFNNVKNIKKKLNLKNITKKEKSNDKINISKKIIFKKDIKDINNKNKIYVFNNQLNKSTNTNNKIRINKLTNLSKYFRIKNKINIDKDYLTERLNLKSDNKNIKRKEINIKNDF